MDTYYRFSDSRWIVLNSVLIGKNIHSAQPFQHPSTRESFRKENPEAVNDTDNTSNSNIKFDETYIHSASAGFYIATRLAQTSDPERGDLPLAE